MSIRLRTVDGYYCFEGLFAGPEPEVLVTTKVSWNRCVTNQSHAD